MTLLVVERCKKTHPYVRSGLYQEKQEGGGFVSFFLIHALFLCRYEFGGAIFVAWAGTFLTVFGGGLLAASCSRSQKSVPKYPKSKPSSSTKEYVWVPGSCSLHTKLLTAASWWFSCVADLRAIRRCFFFFWFFLSLKLMFLRSPHQGDLYIWLVAAHCFQLSSFLP